MPETRKNHLAIDGAQVKEDDHVSSYKPISDTETGDLRPKSLSKSKEKVSDEAEEKLLQKEDEAKIVTRVDMADAKFVVGDHRNGDAKIELDANVRQFSGLTKEELLKYADDPFWVRLRWVMFALFWLLWLAMLAGAIAIIVRAPKCAPPKPRAWYEAGPLADRSSADYAALEAELPELARAKVRGVFISPCQETYEILDSPGCLDQFRDFLKKAQEKSIKVLVDLTANYVPTSHAWFKASENQSAEFADYFVWGKAKDYEASGNPNPPNNWTVEIPSLIGELLSADELPETGQQALGANNKEYGFYKHRATTDQPGLEELYAHWAHIVAGGQGDRVFTTFEDGSAPEWFLSHNSSLRPPAAAPIALGGEPRDVVRRVNDRLGHWPLLQLVLDERSAEEVSRLALLLPGAPLLARGHAPAAGSGSAQSEWFSHVASLRDAPSVQHGAHAVMVVPTNGSMASMIAVARWKAGHSGYVAVFNPWSVARANLTAVPSLPDTLAVHSVSTAVRELTNYTNNLAVQADGVLVPERSTVVLSYVPRTTADQ